MTSPLSPQILALRAPLAAYARAEAAAEEAKRSYLAAKNAFDSYRTSLDDEADISDDSLARMLRDELASRRDTQQRAEKQMAEAAAWVRSVLVEASQAVGEEDGAQAEVPPSTPEAQADVQHDGPRREASPQPEGQDEAAADQPEDPENREERVVAPPVEEAAGDNPLEALLREEDNPQPGPSPTQARYEPEPDPPAADSGRPAEETTTDDKDCEDDADLTFEALLRGEGEVSSPARAEQAQRQKPAAPYEPSSEPPAEPSDSKRSSDTGSSGESSADSTPASSGEDSRLWADILSEEGEEDLLPQRDTTVMGAVVTVCLLAGGFLRPIIGPKTPALKQATRGTQQAAVVSLGSDEVAPIRPGVTPAAPSAASEWTLLASTPVPGQAAAARRASGSESLTVAQALSVKGPREIHLWDGTSVPVEPATMQQDTHQWELPGDRDIIGWHTDTSDCGEDVIVMGGHVSYDGMPGSLAGLAGVGPEDVIECVGHDGQTRRYVPRDYLVASVDDDVEDWHPPWGPSLLLYTCSPELDGSLMVVRFEHQ